MEEVIVLYPLMSKKIFPKPIPLRKLIGPSFIILALGLGSGEVILWPYLVSNYGLGIAWGALLGITFQYFINTEIERYALYRGESVFVGLARIMKLPKYWFIVSTFIGFGLPGIIAASASIISHLFGLEEYKWIAIGLLAIIGFILSSGKTVYGLMERLTKTIILLGVPFIFILALVISTQVDWLLLAQGIFGKGDGYWFLPTGISLMTFLAAFAYSGAGGNLNLTQSIYIKEKGYGMGKYSQKISGLFAQKKEHQQIKLQGESFELTSSNLKKCYTWWRLITREHLFVFWFVGGVSMLLLMLLSYASVFGVNGNHEGINFVINQGDFMSTIFTPVVGLVFLGVIALMLFQTQLGILDSTSRIMSENFAIKVIERNKNSKINLSKIYYVFLWAQILFGIILFLCNIKEPKSLIVLGAVINAFAMFVHIGLVFVLNHRELPKPLRPKLHRKIIMIFIFIFFGCFSMFVLWDKIMTLF